MRVKTLGEPTARTRAYVIHPDIVSDDRGRDPKSQLEEAVSLADALFLDVAGAETVRLSQPRAGWLFGSGKIEELKERIAEAEVDLAIINGAITPKQQQNLEKAWKIKILDRTGLILEIFGERARTREGALQVELAHLKFSAAVWFGPGPILSASAVGSALSAAPVRRRLRPTAGRWTNGWSRFVVSLKKRCGRAGFSVAHESAFRFLSSRWSVIPTRGNQRCSTG